MDFNAILKLVHVTGFAAWFGTTFASLFLLKTLQPGLTGEEGDPASYKLLLMRFIGLETKVADTAVIAVVVSGLLLTHFYHGWTVWAGAKIALMLLQIALTMGYIVKGIHPITYPCDAARYGAWYRLFGISFTMFGVILLVTFFLL